MRTVAKRKAYAGEPYWGRPAPGLGVDRPRIWVLGLAPAAHGANRTGRVFTGDRSGDQLFAALHPPEQSWASRVGCLRTLKHIGYRLGTGVMIGLPGQTVDDLVGDRHDGGVVFDDQHGVAGIPQGLQHRVNLSFGYEFRCLC